MTFFMNVDGVVLLTVAASVTKWLRTRAAVFLRVPDAVGVGPVWLHDIFSFSVIFSQKIVSWRRPWNSDVIKTVIS